MLELIRLYQMGWATLDELLTGLQREAAHAAAHAAKSKKSKK
jgi:hypothetical protein